MSEHSPYDLSDPVNRPATVYEYTTRTYPTEGIANLASEEKMRLARWHRAWADITAETTFVVYRRPMRRA